MAFLMGFPISVCRVDKAVSLGSTILRDGLSRRQKKNKVNNDRIKYTCFCKTKFSGRINESKE